MSKLTLWIVIIPLGFVLLLLGLFGAFNVVTCGPPPVSGGVGLELCLVSYVYDGLADIAGIVIIIIGGIQLVRRKASPENQRAISSP